MQIFKNKTEENYNYWHKKYLLLCSMKLIPKTNLQFAKICVYKLSQPRIFIILKLLDANIYFQLYVSVMPKHLINVKMLLKNLLTATSNNIHGFMLQNVMIKLS